MIAKANNIVSRGRKGKKTRKRKSAATNFPGGGLSVARRSGVPRRDERGDRTGEKPKQGEAGLGKNHYTSRGRLSTSAGIESHERGGGEDASEEEENSMNNVERKGWAGGYLTAEVKSTGWRRTTLMTTVA